MRAAALFAAVLLAGAQAPGWQAYAQDGLTLSAPADSKLEATRDGGVETWRLRNPRFTLTIRSGQGVSDADDSEPPVCYHAQAVTVDGRPALLRVAREHVRLDCPENYASLYLPGLFVAVQARDWDDLATVRAVIATLRLTSS
jgi:hypothetical protein